MPLDNLEHNMVLHRYGNLITTKDSYMLVLQEGLANEIYGLDLGSVARPKARVWAGSKMAKRAFSPLEIDVFRTSPCPPPWTALKNKEIVDFRRGNGCFGLFFTPKIGYF